MSTEVSSGLPWIIIDIAAVLVLGLAAIYGIYMWQQRRKRRAIGSVERAEGPAPLGAKPSGDDRRAA